MLTRGKNSENKKYPIYKGVETKQAVPERPVRLSGRLSYFCLLFFTVGYGSEWIKIASEDSVFLDSVRFIICIAKFFDVFGGREVMKLLESAGKVAHVVIADLFHRAAYRDIRVFQQPHGGVDFDFG